MCRTWALWRSWSQSWWLRFVSSRSVSGPPSGSGLRLLSPRLFSLLSSQSGAKGQMSKISFFQMNNTVSNRKEIIFVNSTIFSHIFSFLCIIGQLLILKISRIASWCPGGGCQLEDEMTARQTLSPPFPLVPSLFSAFYSYSSPSDDISFQFIAFIM